MKKEIKHKPIIETIINTTALAVTATGVVMINSRDFYGFLCVGFGAGLEFFKYWGRKNNYW